MKLLLFFIFFTLSCRHTSLFAEKNWISKKWVINTLSESILSNRIFQGAPTILTPKMIIQGDSLYGLRAYDRVHGNIQWVFPVMGGVEGGLYHEKNRIFFGGSDGFFYCLEVSTGRVLWKFYTGSENLGTPIVFNQIVYFVTSKEKLYALNTRTGKVLWVYVHRSQLKSTGLLSIRGVHRPAADKKNIYAGFRDGVFLALNKNNGKLIWKKTLSQQTDFFKDIDTHSVVIGNFIYTASYSGGLFCLNKINGRLVWRHPYGAYSSPMIEGRFIYYPTVDRRILALDRFSGRKKWSKKLKSLATQPLVYKNSLIFGLSSGGIYVVNKNNGILQTEVDLFKGITTRPTLDSKTGELFVMSNEFWLYKFSLIF